MLAQDLPNQESGRRAARLDARILVTKLGAEKTFIGRVSSDVVADLGPPSLAWTRHDSGDAFATADGLYQRREDHIQTPDRKSFSCRSCDEWWVYIAQTGETTPTQRLLLGIVGGRVMDAKLMEQAYRNGPSRWERAAQILTMASQVADVAAYGKACFDLRRRPALSLTGNDLLHLRQCEAAGF